MDYIYIIKSYPKPFKKIHTHTHTDKISLNDDDALRSSYIYFSDGVL